VVRMNSASGLRRSSGHDSWNRSTGGGAAVSYFVSLSMLVWSLCNSSLRSC
jgi:hypothetical protein